MEVMVTVIVLSAYGMALELFRGLLLSAVICCTNLYQDLQRFPKVSDGDEDAPMW